MKNIFYCLCLISISFSCNKVEDYNELDSPKFLSNDYSLDYDLEIDSTLNKPKLKVVSFNIKYGEELDKAIIEMESTDKISKADIYLLQEMDETSVKTIAENLSLNYIYYPSAFNKKNQKNFGTAVLTRGLIKESKKLFLPHEKWSNGRKRHSTVAFIEFNQLRVVAYSIHTETIEMSRTKRMEQVDSLINDALLVSAEYNQLVLGGDFNTLLKYDIQQVNEKFYNAKFSWATKDSGTTAKSLGINTYLDYIFTKGFVVYKNGRVSSSTASDHKPIYTNLIQE